MFKTRDTASAVAVHGGAAGPQPSSTSVAHRHHTTGPHLDRGSPSEPRLSRSPCPSRWRLRSNNTTTTAGLTHEEARRRLHPLHPSSLTPPALFTFATVEPAIRTPGNKAAVWCLRLAVDVHLLGTHPARRPRHARRHLVTRAAWLDARAAAPSWVVSSTSSPSTVAAEGRSWIGAEEHVEKQRLPAVGVPALL